MQTTTNSKKNLPHPFMPRIPFLINLCLVLALCSACNTECLRVQVDNISRETLASYHVRTPDPRLIYPPQGQRLMVTWLLPYSQLKKNVSIKLQIHYGNHTEKEVWIYPKKMYGFYTYCLMNSEYYEKCGILSYKAEMFIDHCLVKEWQHQLWTRFITFDEKSDEID